MRREAGGGRAHWFAAIWLAAALPAQAGNYPGIGRPATPAEIAAWDIDVRPDFKGLPAGSGSVAKGQEIWDAKCAGCHGTFGESNEVFTPLVGGTKPRDVEVGRVQSLVTGEVGRTTLMKLATLSTLWDYIRRAMPWDKPKSLSVDEVYAVVAYLLNLGDIVAADFVLSDKNIADVQKRLPNRNGMTREHGLWDIKGKPDVSNDACMKNCPTEARLGSAMPDHAKDSHGNLADQNRALGPVRGANTVAPAPAPQKSATHDPAELAKRKACLSCHGVDKRLVGPAFRDVAARYKTRPDAEAFLLERLRRGGSGNWGPLAMPPNPDLGEGDARTLIRWILGGL
jgi:cytochrome c